jgi:hypothetical protein
MTFLSRLLFIPLVLLPLTVQAHSSLSFEGKVGNYRAILNAFGDAVFAEEKTGFDVWLISATDEKDIEYSEATYRIAPKGKPEIASGTVTKEGNNAALDYTFPESDNYVVTLTFSRNGKQLVETPIELYVYSNPYTASSASSVTATAEPSSNTATPIVSGIVIVALIGGMGWYFLRKRI